MILNYSNSETFRPFENSFSFYSYSATSEIIKPIREYFQKDDLTNLCMEVSEKSLSKDWDEEDDEYWASYLKD